MIPIVVHAALAVLGIIFRYNLGAVNSTKVVGEKLSEVQGGSVQNAITPPALTKASLITWLLIVFALGYEVYAFGVASAAIGLACFCTGVIFAGAVIVPGPESQHFLSLIYRSMVNRSANYEKENDQQRAGAMDSLRQRFEQTYPMLFLN